MSQREHRVGVCKSNCKHGLGGCSNLHVGSLRAQRLVCVGGREEVCLLFEGRWEWRLEP